MSLRDEAKSVAAQQGAKLAAKGFQRLMDRFDAHPIFRAQLVRSFRRFFGITTTAEKQAAREDLERASKRAVDEYFERRRK